MSRHLRGVGESVPPLRGSTSGTPYDAPTTHLRVAHRRPSVLSHATPCNAHPILSKFMSLWRSATSSRPSIIHIHHHHYHHHHHHHQHGQCNRQYPQPTHPNSYSSQAAVPHPTRFTLKQQYFSRWRLLLLTAAPPPLVVVPSSSSPIICPNPDLLIPALPPSAAVPLLGTNSPPPLLSKKASRFIGSSISFRSNASSAAVPLLDTNSPPPLLSKKASRFIGPSISFRSNASSFPRSDNPCRVRRILSLFFRAWHSAIPFQFSLILNPYTLSLKRRCFSLLRSTLRPSALSQSLPDSFLPTSAASSPVSTLTHHDALNQFLLHIISIRQGSSLSGPTFILLRRYFSLWCSALSSPSASQLRRAPYEVPPGNERPRE